jgi:pyruvate dehydrogenase E1 component beta subunit
MRILNFAQAIKEGMREEMRRDEMVFLMGEDIAGDRSFGGGFGVTNTLIDDFGKERVRNTPISEQAIVGMAVGAAAVGMRPIAELMFCDFVGCAMDQLLNQAAKMRYMYGGRCSVPMVLRMPMGGGKQSAAQHSQSLEALLAHIPGLKVVVPSTPIDAYGLIISSIRDENPVMFFEHKAIYVRKGEVPDAEENFTIPLGVADIKREGEDVTVIATALCVHKALEAAEELEREKGIKAEVVDPRTLYPFDKETIYRSVIKTGRVVIATEESKRSAWSAEVASNIAEDIFENLKKKIVRIGMLNTPIPVSKPIEAYVIPQKDDIKNAILNIC